VLLVIFKTLFILRRLVCKCLEHAGQFARVVAGRRRIKRVLTGQFGYAVCLRYWARAVIRSARIDSRSRASVGLPGLEFDATGHVVTHGW